MDDTRPDADREQSHRIRMSQEKDIQHWCEKFGVSKARLEEAVNAVGPEVQRVQEYLARRPG